MRGRVDELASRGGRRQHRRGLTLTEVLVSLMILAGAMVPILKALTQAHRGGTLIERRSTCWLLAQSQMEELRARALAQWDSSWGQSSRAMGEGFYCTITDSGPAGDLRTVRVQTGFDEDESGSLSDSEVSAELASLIARRD